MRRQEFLRSLFFFDELEMWQSVRDSCVPNEVQMSPFLIPPQERALWQEVTGEQHSATYAEHMAAARGHHFIRVSVRVPYSTSTVLSRASIYYYLRPRMRTSTVQPGSRQQSTVRYISRRARR